MKGVKITGIIITILVLSFIGVQYWLGTKAREIIIREVTKFTNGASSISIGDVSIRLLTRSAFLRNIYINTNEDMLATSKGSLKQADIGIKSLGLTGIHYKSHKNGKKAISIGSINIDTPNAEFALAQNYTTATADTIKNSQRQVTEVFEKFEIKDITIENCNVTYKTYKDGDTVSMVVKDLYLEADNIRLHPEKKNDRELFTSEDIRTRLSSFVYQYGFGSMILEVKDLAMGIRDKQGTISEVSLTPQYSKYLFALNVPKHPDWTKIKTGHITLEGFEVEDFLNENIIRATKVDINNVNIDTYKNRQIPQEQKEKKLLYESIQELPFKVNIHQLNIKNVDVEYEELSLKGDEPGKLTFTELNGTFYGLTNMHNPINPYMKLYAQGKLMNQGNLQATFLFPTTSLKDKWEVYGSLGPMELEVLNPMTEPLVDVKVRSGFVKGMNFFIIGDSKYSSVDLTMLYDDLNIALIKEEPDGEESERILLSGLINGLIIKDRNPVRRRIRSGDGSTERDIYRSQFNYLWRSLLPGLKETVGIPNL